MPASLEFLDMPAFVCRVGKDHNVFGDPYTFVCTVLDMGEGVARIVGASGDTYDTSVAYSINNVLVRRGFRFVEYVRIRPNERLHTVRRRLKP